MDIAKHFSEAGSWLDGSGPQSDIVLSSRIRLARNISGYLFFAQADSQQRKEIHDLIRQQLMSSELKDQLSFFDMEKITPLERQILSERHLISRQLAQGKGSRGVAINQNEQLSLMINEEDHLRIQGISSGLQLHETYETINRIDQLLEKSLSFSFSPQYGYLTACPTNVGTGIRVSVMLHLPALKMTHQIEKALRAAKDMGLAVRGLYGEGSEPVGDFYQLSNQITLGKSETQIIDELVELAVNPITAYERQARSLLFNQKQCFLDNKIFRALGVLTHARMISSEESMYLLSYIRLGIYLGCIKNISLDTTNRLLLLVQPGHLQNLCHENLDANGRDEYRATLIRKQLTATA